LGVLIIRGVRTVPLKQGYSDKTISKNITEMRDSGRDHEEAVAAALETARKAFKKRNPGKALPKRLRK